MKNSGDCLYNNVNVLNITDLYVHLKIVTMVNFMLAIITSLLQILKIFVKHFIQKSTTLVNNGEGVRHEQEESHTTSVLPKTCISIN